MKERIPAERNPLRHPHTMMNNNFYLDGFVLVLPKAKIDAYVESAQKAADLWLEYGALAFAESCGDDLDGNDDCLSFLKLAACGPDETVVFSWITFRDRAHRDEVNAKVMADPRIQEMCEACGAIFDPKRMAYGGFKGLLQRNLMPS